jgi:hypothetical protein
VLDPFQVVAKMTAIFWGNVSYAYVNYAANSVRDSFEIISLNDTNVFEGQTTLTKLPGFNTPPQKMFYSTSIFGPLDWTILSERFNSGANVNVKICEGTVCEVKACKFGVDKPVLKPEDIGL